MYYIFKEMKSSIYSEEDKILFDEVITCFNSGAYRAAYIMNWICIAESLKHKLKFMAQRDCELQDFVRDMEEGKLDSGIDKTLITKSKGINFISEFECEKISEIQRLRNRYAHPNNVSPHSDEVMAAIRTGVDIVLSKKPLLRHGFVKNTLKTMTEDYHYLDDNEDIIKAFTKSIVSKIHSDVNPFLLKESVKKLEEIFNDVSINKRYKRRLLFFISTYLKEIKPDLIDSVWDIDSLIGQYPLSLSTILVNEELFPLCGELVRSRIINLNLEPIVNGKVTTPSVYSFKKTYSLKQLNLLTSDQEDKLNKIINVASYQVLFEAEIPIINLYNRIIKDFKSHNWYVQNPVAEYICDSIKYISSLDYSKQVELGRNILQSAVGGSTSAEDLINKVNTEEIGAEGIIEGMILETIVNEESKLRFKGLRYLQDILYTIDSNNFENVILNCIEQTKASTVYFIVTETQFEQYKQKIDTVQTNSTNYELKLSLVEFKDLVNSKLEEYKDEQ